MGLIQQIKKDEDLDKTYDNLMGISNSSSESGNSEEEPVIEKQTSTKNSSNSLENVNTTMVKYSDAEERLQQDVSAILQEKVAQNPEAYTADVENLQAVQERKTKLVIDSALNLMENGDYKVPRQDRQQVAKDVAANIVGFGVLQRLLDDDNISEIMVNGAKSIYVEEKGLLHLTDVQFKNEAQCSQIIDRILAPLGRHVDEASPDVDARLPDGSRVNVIIPPLALNGNVITIRKFPKSSITMDDMIKFGSLDRRMASFLEACVLAKESTIVSGSTSSGKSLAVSNKLFSVGKQGELIYKKIGDIKVGDSVYSRSGAPTKVIGVYPQGKLPVYEVELKDGRIITCSGNHQWTIAKTSHGAIVECVMTTNEMLEKGVIRLGTNYKDGIIRHQSKYWLPNSEMLKSESVGLPIHPWLLGALIGNGYLCGKGSRLEFSTADVWFAEKINKIYPDGNLIKRNSHNYSWGFLDHGVLKAEICNLGLDVYSHEKFIPEIYKYASTEQRIELIRGLFDTDGSCSKDGHASYSTVSKQLATDVLDVMRTLGFTGRITKDERANKYKNSDGTAYVVHISGGHTNPFSYLRKAEKYDKNYGRKHEARVAQSYVDCEEDKYSYLAGFLFQTKLIRNVPHIHSNKLNPELMERLLSALPEHSSFISSREQSDFSINCPSVPNTNCHNGVVSITKSLGYADTPVMERSIPDGMLNADFLRGMADFSANIHGGNVTFTLSDHVLDEIEKLLKAVRLNYTRINGEICIPYYPSELVHDSEKVRLLREWESGYSGNYTLRNDYTPIVDIRKTNRSEEMVCIKVADDSHTFVLADGTVTHNTTLLNALSGYIPSNERILTIEDSAELRLLQDHVVRLESRPANIDGKGRVTINDLVINALRMRPDRLIVGECRGEETLAMLQAMNTGHDGSLTTVHANHSKDVVSRLETMASMASTTLSEAAIKSQIASAINIIVQQARLQDGSRKIVEITEITGMEGNVISMQKIFEFVQTGVRTTVKDGKMVKKVEGYFDATGVRPKCYDKFVEMGIHVGDDWFEKRHKE